MSMYLRARNSGQLGLTAVVFCLLAVMVLLPAAQPAQAAPKPVKVVVNGAELDTEVSALLLNDSVYVPVRSVFEQLNTTVHYAAEESLVTVQRGATQVIMELDAPRARINGNEVQLETPPEMREGKLFVPVRFVAERFDLDVHWEGILKTVYISAPQYIANNGRPYENLEPVIDYNDDELDLFERVVFAECRDEPYIGYVAVAAVIINRVQSPDWPDTLRGVMMQPGQFQVVANGTYKWKANDWAKKAVREALVGADPSQNALFFFNPQRSTVRAMFKRPITTVIGGHRFTR